MQHVSDDDDDRFVAVWTMQVESAGRHHSRPVGCRHRSRGGRVRSHSNQSDHHPRHARHENSARSVSHCLLFCSSSSVIYC